MRTPNVSATFADVVKASSVATDSAVSDAACVTRHIASTSMYSLTFRVRVTKRPQYGRNGTASLQITSRTQQDFVAGACVRAACGGPGGLPLGSATHY